MSEQERALGAPAAGKGLPERMSKLDLAVIQETHLEEWVRRLARETRLALDENERLRGENTKMREAAGNGCGVCHCRALAEAEETIEYLNSRLDKLNHAPSWATAWCCAACEPDASASEPSPKAPQKALEVTDVPPPSDSKG